MSYEFDRFKKHLKSQISSAEKVSSDFVYLTLHEGKQALEAAESYNEAEWVMNFCSKCGISKYNWFEKGSETSGPIGVWNYCPGCGAKIRDVK